MDEEVPDSETDTKDHSIVHFLPSGSTFMYDRQFISSVVFMEYERCCE